MDLVLIRLVDIGFNTMFSDPHCRYVQPSGGFVLIRLVDIGFNQIGRHWF